MRGRSWTALGLLFLLTSCRPPPFIDIRLQLDCVDTGSGPPVSSCGQLQLGCANFFEFRLYQSDSVGTLGNLLASTCLPASQLGNPTDLCRLEQRPSPLPLLTNLPDGKTVRFRARGMNASDPKNGCNDDVPGTTGPRMLFDGFSGVVPLDGNDHQVPIPLGVCDSC